MPDKIDPIRETDDEAIALARKLVSENRYAALGVREVDTGVPLVSRIAYTWTSEIGVYFCASDLSVHSKCLAQDNACSMLIGEPGKGDGLAYPRITIIGKVVRMDNDNPKRMTYRKHFLTAHPKAELYVDFADFGFYPLEIERALLNGGFGKAYHLSAKDMAFMNG